MTWTNELPAILPELLLTGYAFLLLLAAMLFPREQRRWIGYLALVCTFVTGAIVVRSWMQLPVEPVRVFEGLFTLDPFSLFFKLVFLAVTLLTILISLRSVDEEEDDSGGEYYALLLFATLGMMFLASASNLLMMFVALETMSLSSYILVGYLQRDRRSNEAAVKYFVLGAFSSGILAFGMSLVYGATASTDFHAIAEVAAARPDAPLLVFGMLLMMVAFGFKVAAVPFHMWVPDVYEGAPSPITAFISTAGKAAAFAVLVRLFAIAFLPMSGVWQGLLAFLALTSMTVGNVAAILQDNMKRMLAYSSIAHAGYILMGLLAIGQGGEVGSFGLTAVGIYLLVYGFMNVGAFGFVIWLRSENLAGDRIADFGGLSRRAPLAAFALLVLMLSLAGIPTTAGFVGKWYLFGAAIRANYTWLAIAAVLNSAVSLYYYLRVVVVMYVGEPVASEGRAASPFVLVALAICLGFTLVIGCYPQPLIEMARAALLQ
jgi:NADH-quinone oxidoreductase subunit N